MTWHLYLASLGGHPIRGYEEVRAYGIPPGGLAGVSPRAGSVLRRRGDKVVAFLNT